MEGYGGPRIFLGALVFVAIGSVSYGIYQVPNDFISGLGWGFLTVGGLASGWVWLLDKLDLRYHIFTRRWMRQSIYQVGVLTAFVLFMTGLEPYERGLWFGSVGWVMWLMFHWVFIRDYLLGPDVQRRLDTNRVYRQTAASASLAAVRKAQEQEDAAIRRAREKLR